MMWGWIVLGLGAAVAGLAVVKHSALPSMPAQTDGQVLPVGPNSPAVVHARIGQTIQIVGESPYRVDSSGSSYGDGGPVALPSGNGLLLIVAPGQLTVNFSSNGRGIIVDAR